MKKEEEKLGERKKTQKGVKNQIKASQNVYIYAFGVVDETQELIQWMDNYKMLPAPP